MCLVGGHFYIDPPIHQLPVHMHTQPGMSDLREVLQNRENLVWRHASRQRPAEETEEEGEEEEKVRLVYFTLISRLSSCNYYVFEAGAGNNKTVCALCA